VVLARSPPGTKAGGSLQTPSYSDSIFRNVFQNKCKRHLYLETSWAPVNELNSSLGLDAGNSGLGILGHDVTAVEETASHLRDNQYQTIQIEHQVVLLYLPS